MFNQDIRELLEHTKGEINSITQQVEGNSLNKILVKNTLENLRSILDYSAQDIQSVLTPDTNKKVYFPYGKRENHFKNSIKRNLPSLANNLPAIHSLLENIQPYKCGDPWLTDLCELTNDAKHNNLSKTENKKTQTINQGYGGIVVSGNITNGNISGNIINGVLQYNVNIDNSGIISVEKISGQTVISEDNKIIFQGKKIEVSSFLNRCHTNLSTFIEALYKHVKNA